MENVVEISIPKKRTWLKVKRIERDLNQAQVAKAVGMNQTMYSYLEQGKLFPSEEEAKKIGEFLDFDWMMFYK